MSRAIAHFVGGLSGRLTRLANRQSFGGSLPPNPLLGGRSASPKPPPTLVSAVSVNVLSVCNSVGILPDGSGRSRSGEALEKQENVARFSQETRRDRPCHPCNAKRPFTLTDKPLGGGVGDASSPKQGVWGISPKAVRFASRLNHTPASKGSQLLTSPEFNRAIAASRNQNLTIGRKGDRIDLAGVPNQRVTKLAVGQVP
jgi:hypothetical protein